MASSLVSSADELLKSRSIPELRQLVKTLETDAVSKVSELQHMVGSKYHDFIQSADAIATMQQKSEQFEGNLGQIIQLAQDVTVRTNELLSKMTDSNNRVESNKLPYRGIANNGPVVLDGTSVWNYLEDCDIYSAAAVVVQAQIVLDRVGGKKCSFGAASFLSPAVQKDVPPGRASLVPGCSAAAFLSQTVVDDARLLLLEGSCSTHDKARSLASFGLLSAAAGSAFLSRAELLAQYLAAADVLLDAAIDAPEAAAHQQQQNHQQQQQKQLARAKGHLGGKTAATATAAHAPSGSQQSGEKLIAAVRILQTAILDAHLLFFKTTELAPVSRPASKPTAAAGAGAGAGAVDGLVALYQATFLRDVDAALTALLASLGATGKGDAAPAHDAGATFLAHVRGAGSGGADVRRVFDEWLGKSVQRLGAWSSGALAGMGSALEVARLQQRVWVAATQANAGLEGPGSGSGDSGHDTAPSVAQKDWDQACVELLTVKRRRQVSDGSSSGSAQGFGHGQPGTMLWTRVFRQPFMVQVERLLRESCQEVLGGARALLLHALAADGVQVDPASLAVTVASAHRDSSHHQPHHGSSSGDASNNGPEGGAAPLLLLQPLSVPSPRLFRRAEAVRQFIQDELADLLRDVVLPGQEGDPEAAQGLARALYVQCSQLVGHVAVLLRSLSTALSSALEAQARALNKAKAHATTVAARAPSIEASADACAPLLSGLLLVGRLAWLLKIRGRFVEEALAPTAVMAAALAVGAETTSSSSFSAHMSSAYDSISEDQMRSAFEIADTNGDGVLTYAEAIDAVQALTVSDADSLSASGGSSIPFLGPRLTPSLNYHEFALLCAHMLSPESCLPVGRFAACLDDLLASVHRIFAERSLGPLVAQLSGSLERELGLSLATDGTAAANDGVGAGQPATFKAFWRREGVELDGGEREQVAIPTACCAALSAFFFQVAHVAASSLLSIDTVQDMPGPDVYPSPSTHVSPQQQQHGLALFASSALFTKAVEVAAQKYMELLKAAPSAAAAAAAAAAADNTHGAASEEDVALQACFDLLVCEALSARLAPTTGAAASTAAPRLLKTTLAGWKARLDPINAELLMPLVLAASARFANSTHLLLPCLAAPPTPKDRRADQSLTATAADNVPGSAATAIAGVFPTAQPARFALLPLPMSTHAAWSDRGQGGVGKKPRQAQPAEDDDADAVGALPARSTTSTGMTGLMSSIGTFLGNKQ